MFCNIPLLRYVLLREQIDIVHGHSAFSALAHEAMYVGKLLGLRVSAGATNGCWNTYIFRWELIYGFFLQTVFTDHRYVYSIA